MKALAIPGLTTDDDLRWLATQAALHSVIVEIGPYKGRSTRALADATPGVVYAIDNWNAATASNGVLDRRARATCYRNLADLLEVGKVCLIEQDSGAGVPPVLEGLAVDMVWIDGDHSYDAVCADLRSFGPLVRPGGLVCGHDYCVWHPEVVRAVDDTYGARVQSLSIHRSIWWVVA